MTLAQASSTANSILPTSSSLKPTLRATRETNSRIISKLSVWLGIRSWYFRFAWGNPSPPSLDVNRMGLTRFRLREAAHRLVFIFPNLEERWKAEQIKNAIDFLVHVGQFDVAFAFADLLDASHKNAQPGAADVSQVSEIYHDFDAFLVNQFLQSVFQIRRGVRVEIAFQAQHRNLAVVGARHFKPSHARTSSKIC